MEDAPELADIDGWLNTEPVTLEDCSGSPVLLNFWTYSCVNCVRMLPAVRELWEAYGDTLTVIGVHTPEFAFEEEQENVEWAVEEYGIEYPVALDSNNTTWKLYGNIYWPRQALIGPDGTIRYESIGEGGRAELEEEVRGAVRRAGGEAGDRRFDGSEAVPDDATTSPDVYAGAAHGGRLGNDQPSAPHTTVDFTDEGEHRMNRIYLEGPWRQEDEYLAAEGEGYAAVRFSGSACDAVLGPAGATFEVELGGDPLPAELRGEHVREDDGAAVVDVERPGMYQLLEREEPRVSELVLRPRDGDGRVYACRFG